MRITFHTSNFYCVAIIIGVLRARRSSRHRTGFLAISMSVRLVIDLSLRFDWCYGLHEGYMWIIWSAFGLMRWRIQIWCFEQEWMREYRTIAEIFRCICVDFTDQLVLKWGALRRSQELHHWHRQSVNRSLVGSILV